MINKLAKIFGSKTKALEILYILHGLKPVARQGFYESELPKVEAFCSANKLFIEKAPYKVIIADSEKRYSNKGIRVKLDDPRRGMQFVYISKDEKKAAMADALEYKKDHRSLGLLLGYPSCCVDFFVRNEPKRSKLDNDYVECTLENSKGIRYPFFTNICKRGMDITLLNHFPCSFNCEKSIKLAKLHLQIISRYDRNLAMRYVKELKCRVNIGERFVGFC